jgi:peptidoglycan/LPS O-acetylase OafA/YrhL
VSDAGTVPPEGLSRSRYLELEAIRGLAALAVVVHHAYQHTEVAGVRPLAGRGLDTLLSSLDGAVAVFLALSGLLLFLPVARAVLAGRPTRSAATFLRRRAARVLPLYLVAVTTVWAWRTPTLPGDWRDLLAHLTFTHVYAERTIFSLIGPAWSLAVEVTFYLLVALSLRPLSWVATRVASRRARLAVLVAVPTVAVAGSIGYKLWAGYVAGVPGDRFTVWFSVPAKLDAFALGMLLAVALAARPSPAPWSPRTVTAVRAAAVVVATVAVVTREPGGWSFLLFHTLVAVAAVLLLAGMLLAPSTSAVVRVASRAPLTALGLWSYSIYLWHEPLMMELAARVPGVAPGPTGFLVLVAVLVPASLVVGWASYRLIEVPTAVLAVPIDTRRRYGPLQPSTDLGTPVPPSAGIAASPTVASRSTAPARSV